MWFANFCLSSQRSKINLFHVNSCKKWRPKLLGRVHSKKFSLDSERLVNHFWLLTGVAHPSNAMEELLPHLTRPSQSQLCTPSTVSNYTNRASEIHNQDTRRKSRAAPMPGSNNLCIRALRLRDCVLHIHRKSAPGEKMRARAALFQPWSIYARSLGHCRFFSAVSCCPFSCASGSATRQINPRPRIISQRAALSSERRSTGNYALAPCVRRTLLVRNAKKEMRFQYHLHFAPVAFLFYFFATQQMRNTQSSCLPDCGTEMNEWNRATRYWLGVCHCFFLNDHTAPSAAAVLPPWHVYLLQISSPICKWKQTDEHHKENSTKSCKKYECFPLRYANCGAFGKLFVWKVPAHIKGSQNLKSFSTFFFKAYLATNK